MCVYPFSFNFLSVRVLLRVYSKAEVCHFLIIEELARLEVQECVLDREKTMFKVCILFTVMRVTVFV